MWQRSQILRGDLLCVPISIPMEAFLRCSLTVVGAGGLCKMQQWEALVVQLQTAPPSSSKSEIVHKAACMKCHSVLVT